MKIAILDMIGCFNLYNVRYLKFKNNRGNSRLRKKPSSEHKEYLTPVQTNPIFSHKDNKEKNIC